MRGVLIFFLIQYLPEMNSMSLGFAIYRFLSSTRFLQKRYERQVEFLSFMIGEIIQKSIKFLCQPSLFGCLTATF